MKRRSLHTLLSALALAVVLGGCTKSAPPSVPEADAAKAPDKVRFQTDWFAQAEHGGFYQALVKGYYKAANLDVNIIPGGPGPTMGQLLLSGQIDLAMGRSDDVIVWSQQGLPFEIVAVYMERDPQALLIHDEDPVKGFADLNNRTVMVESSVHWLEYVRKKYHVAINQIPLNYGIGSFMADKSFIQQCFVTDEPYYVRKSGGHPRTLMLADSGYNPYRIIFGTKAFIDAHPEAVRRFIAASLRGWDEFMKGDADAAKAEIAKRNDNMPKELIEYSIQAMKDHDIIYGKPEAGERLGLMTKQRMLELDQTLADLKLIPQLMPLESFVRFDLLPAELQPAAQ
ncbi:MAG TPA: ABC transporter substrate-binding protein [Opitutaceae bacterium]|jgi:NitT/TauT family transport system substrate-binding protein|nr:ABC transporter substrate-binding protein [Opitutaceae bacterium]